MEDTPEPSSCAKFNPEVILLHPATSLQSLSISSVESGQENYPLLPSPVYGHAADDDRRQSSPNPCDLSKSTHPTKWWPALVAQPTSFIPLTGNALTFFLDPYIQIPSPPRRGLLEGRYSFTEDDDNISWGSPASSSPPNGLFSFLPGSIGEDSSSDEDDDLEKVAEALKSSPELLDDVFLLRERIDKEIKLLGGAVLPKINHKAPKDARWISLNKSLRCTSGDDVLLLLKHSFIIDKALENPDAESEHTLALVKWDDGFGPDQEFRCFVHEDRLVLISQRDLNQAYQSIASDSRGIIQDIYAFFRTHVYGYYDASNCYVFDVIRDRNRVVLIDVCVFDRISNPDFITWAELKDLDKKMVKSIGEEGGMGLDLEHVLKYGSPFLRYATDASVASPNPDLQCPLPLEMTTIMSTCMPRQSGSASVSSTE